VLRPNLCFKISATRACAVVQKEAFSLGFSAWRFVSMMLASRGQMMQQIWILADDGVEFVLRLRRCERVLSQHERRLFILPIMVGVRLSRNISVLKVH